MRRLCKVLLKITPALLLGFSLTPNQASACKIAANLKWSKENIQHLLAAAEATGSYPGYFIAEIKSAIPESRIWLKNGSGHCKTLLFSASQPACNVVYKFVKEEACKDLKSKP